MKPITIAKAKKKVIEAFMKQYRGRPCEVCGTTYGTCGHHYISRGSCPRHIVSPDNIIVLCQSHHGPYGKQMNPHSGDPFLSHAFNQWVRANKPEMIEWATQHRNDSVAKAGKIDWLGLYEQMVLDKQG